MDVVRFLELHWFELIFALVIISMIYQVAKNGGFKNALFSAKKLDEVGSVQARKRIGVNSSLVVSKMQDTDSDEEIVGIALVAKGFLSYSMQPISLTKKDAKELAALLEKASEKK